MRASGGSLSALSLVGLFWLVSLPARAADTVETWDRGGADAEAYATLEPTPGGEPALLLEAVAGYGVAERLSAYLQLELGWAGDVEWMPHAGVFGTPLETEHLDLDLMFDLAFDGDELSGNPGLELNLDQEPDQSSIGTYLRVGVPIDSHMVQRTGRQHADDADESTELPCELTWGAYVTPADGQQLFVESDGAIGLGSGLAEWVGVALGYNLMLTEAAELITQAYAAAPGLLGSEDLVIAGTVGLIVGFPAPDGDADR